MKNAHCAPRTKRPLLIVALALALSLAPSLACSDEHHQIGVGPASDGGALPDGGAPLDTPPSGHPLMLASSDAVKRLAQLLWQTTPDAALIAAAGTLKTREDVGALAQQMLKDPRARVGVGAFYRWWLDLDKVSTVVKDATTFAAWNTDVGSDAARETETFAVNVTLEMNGSFRTLMTGPFSYLNERLAGLYGVSGVAGTALQKVDLDPAQRAGLLTQPSLLALHATATRTSISGRGHFLRQALFCTEIPNAPATSDVPPPATNLPANATARQRLESDVAGATCHSCHQLMDPLGYAYEGLDGIGQSRTVDNGSPVDLTSALTVTPGTDVTFNGPVQLATLLADNTDVHRCMARQWLTYALARPVPSGNEATVDGVRDAFKAAGLDLRALIAAVAQSDLFLAP